jgi:hypothetical protein
MNAIDTLEASPPAERPHLPWWASPAGICLGFLLPVLFLIASVGQAELPGVVIRGARFLDGAYLALGALLLLVIALAGWLGQQFVPRPRPAPATLLHWDTAACAIGVVAGLAYVYWLKGFIVNPMLLLQTLLGNYRPDRSDTQLALTSGITSLTNVAPVFFSIYAFRVAFPGPRIGRTLHWLCGVLLALTVFRVYVWSERLALIETVVPFALAAGAVAARSERRVVRVLTWLGPFIAIPLLILYFGIAESVRSWTAAAYNGKLEFWDFAIGRMASYYYTSLNNGAAMLHTQDWPTWRFEYTLLWLHKAPLAIGTAFSDWINVRFLQPEDLLTRYLDIEFNNPSGLYAVVCDLGLPLGVMYFAGVALLGGLLFRSYGAGRLGGALAYPMFFLSFLEVFRYPYLGQPRAFTWGLGILAVLLIVHFRTRLSSSVVVQHDARDAGPAATHHLGQARHG